MLHFAALSYIMQGISHPSRRNTGKDKAERAVERRREKKHPHKERDVLEELERELEEDPYADSEFSWLTDEPAEGAETKEEQQS